MQAIIRAIQNGELNGEARVVISNNSNSQALARARECGISCYHLSEVTAGNAERLDRATCEVLVNHDVNLVILSGYMKRLGARTLQRYHNRIVNVHPALLPKFGGKGMYGDRVHEAVLRAGEAVTGATIHLADSEYDHGRILGQRKVPVLEGDTPKTLAERVRKVEATFFVDMLRAIADGDVQLDDPSV